MVKGLHNQVLSWKTSPKYADQKLEGQLKGVDGVPMKKPRVGRGGAEFPPSTNQHFSNQWPYFDKTTGPIDGFIRL